MPLRKTPKAPGGAHCSGSNPSLGGGENLRLAIKIPGSSATLPLTSWVVSVLSSVQWEQHWSPRVMPAAFSQQHGRRLLAVHQKRVCDHPSRIFWSCSREASDSQWVLKTDPQFPSESSLCQCYKQTGNLRNNQKLTICLGQSAQTIKDSPLNRAYCSSQLSSPADGCSSRSCRRPISSLAKHGLLVARGSFTV